mmetsp:Transcript_14232/g.44062  ORF Transcript_14232/g.44062 Transcript_14232/m.44062 type:complete len:118 (+) Transcript_14232:3-356(+)
MLGVSHEGTILTGNNLSSYLTLCGHFGEARTFAREQLALATESLGPTHQSTIFASVRLCGSLVEDPAATHDDLNEAVSLAEDALQKRRRILGPAHPSTRFSERVLKRAREKLQSKES